MDSLALLIGALVAGVLFLHPFVFYPLSLKLLRRRPLNEASSTKAQSATLVFCAFNERASVDAKIENLRRIREITPDLKFACYVDLSTDGTLEALQAHADLLDIHAATERTGKAVGMSILAKAIQTDLMIFTDANVIVEPQSVPRLLGYFDDPDVGGVCGRLVYINDHEGATATTSSTYWRLEEAVKTAESQVGSTMGADGSIFATRRTYYPFVPSHLLDDFIVSMSVIFSGLRLISVPDVIAYERAVTDTKDEFRRKRRIACRAFSSHRYIWPQVRRLPLTDRYKYVSHRVIRWLSFVWFAVAAILFATWLIASFKLAGGLLVLAAVALVAIGGRWPIPIASHAAEAVSAFWATFLGVVDSLRGKTYQTWQPAQSRNRS